jgi:hypothetical protein
VAVIVRESIVKLRVYELFLLCGFREDDANVVMSYFFNHFVALLFYTLGFILFWCALTSMNVLRF